MKITYIHHSCFLVETDTCYYLFDYEKGRLPELEVTKPIMVFASHGHYDHYNPEIFPMLVKLGMQNIYGILSGDIEGPKKENILKVDPGKQYTLWLGQELTTFQSTDLGVAFLIEDQGKVIYHAGDLNEWVWEEESDEYNTQMTKRYRQEIDLLSKKMNRRQIDVAFLVMDPRQGNDYDRGICYFLEKVPVLKVYPMHYWREPAIINRYLNEHPEYKFQIQKTEKNI